MKKPLNNINLKINKIISLVLILMMLSCSSTKLIKSWKNPDYYRFNPKKILVVGATPNYEARKAYEFQLITELNARKINALQSAVVFEKSFQDSKQTEKDIEVEIDKLLLNGYDTVLVSLVKGIDDNQSYASDSPKTDYHLRKFIGYYLLYQDAYFNQDYYNRYKVFNIETSIYNLKKESDKSLVWRGSFDLIDPTNSSEAIDSHIKKLIKTLEKEKIIPKK
ncbi:hypothetical protein [Flavivirga rizhaonensis]|uniref:DUF4136 domain-containing protein n=1 Tax=Flavivirga rizhaonensis TaxID=2559571 RepID=A0A4V3P582_9FLAO|nr:hypothetical protein [Flavivirga rizhaonensis]TGV04324.1 hypothetical protein EM932_02050 [Flavivirga rizhaonensis]